MSDDKRRILLVEDDARIAKLVADYLEMSGFEVLVARDGDEALKKARAERPHIVVLDLVLPQRSGLDVCAQLKDDPNCQHMPIILYTGKDRDDVISSLGTDGDLLRQSRADAYVAKVDGAPALIRKIRALLEGTPHG